MKKLFSMKPNEKFIDIKVKPFLNKRNNQMSIAIPKKILIRSPSMITIRFPKSNIRSKKY